MPKPRANPYDLFAEHEQSTRVPGDRRELVRDVVVPYPPSVNNYFGSGIALKDKTSRGAFAQAAVAYSRDTVKWSVVARHLRTLKFINSKGESFRQAVARHLFDQRREGRVSEQPIIGPLSIRVIAYPPALVRKRDTDNLLKSLLDALTRAGLWLDDSQIHETRLRWGEPMPGDGHVRLVAKRLDLAVLDDEDYLHG